ncbi:methyltransferase type 11 [Luteitalea sp. TBR-22]|uniref:class I SAM-dependent methyltransferase n=1 Tax=Luteitalea sp. TBR-22 TaxID=2802971 RepID=UPI001AF686B4|nr:class I SAM-dependent methyltransferase [Luteitalea sp. TBR-22]BCS31444.1 methyltransferase type 11 [Luteitalea sp. TBR-22]
MGTTIQPHNLRAAAVWSRGGKAYDEISRGISDAIAHCVLRLDPQAPDRILDLATGTGWTSRQVARHGAAVIGADIAEELIESARLRAAAERLDIEYRVADAEQLPFGHGEFDAVISTFGVMFASRPEAVATELARVVRPGGRIALATWAPQGAVYGMFMTMKPYMPAAPTPAPPSPFAWGDTARVRELLGQAFDLRFEPGTSFYREPSAEAAWETFSTGYGPTRTLAESLDPERRRALREDFIAFHEGFATELGICVPRDYLITIGTRR